MGIDRIGGPKPTDLSIDPKTHAEKSSGKSFTESLAAKDAASAANVEGKPLDDLRAGRIDLVSYLDRRVAEATSHLEHLPPETLERVRSIVRDELTSDPMLRALVEQATGKMPDAEG